MPRLKKKPLSLSGNALLALGLGGCITVVGLALFSTRFLRREAPAPPLVPTRVEHSASGLPKFAPSYYRALIDDDSRRYGIAPMAPGMLAQPLTYGDELAQPRRLKANEDLLDTPHLHLVTRVLKEWATTASGQGFRYEHMVLQITNRTDRRIAYRVQTTVEHPEKCKTKGAIGHNALALAPGETVMRTECLWQPGATLEIERVEVIELPPLGYYYVSRLNPSQVLLEERTAAGHDAPMVKQCQFLPWRDITASKASWADVIDFYARHNCDEYSFWPGYRRWETMGNLPSHPTAASAP